MSAPTNQPSLDSLSPLDWYRTIRDQIQHEDNLIVQRLAWLMAAQSFFFTGYAIIANGTPTPRNQLLAKQQDLLFNIIPAVACLSDLLIYASVLAGIIALAPITSNLLPSCGSRRFHPRHSRKRPDPLARYRLAIALATRFPHRVALALATSAPVRGGGGREVAGGVISNQ